MPRRRMPRARPAGGAPIAGCSAMLYGSSNTASSWTVPHASTPMPESPPARARRWRIRTAPSWAETPRPGSDHPDRVGDERADVHRRRNRAPMRRSPQPARVGDSRLGRWFARDQMPTLNVVQTRPWSARETPARSCHESSPGVRSSTGQHRRCASWGRATWLPNSSTGRRITPST
jgi:hypothetical protein